MDATLCGVDIYCKEYKRIKSVCQCNNYGGVGVTKGVAAGLSDVNKQYDGLYYVAACVFMRHHSHLKNPYRRLLVSQGWEMSHSRNLFTLSSLPRKLLERTLKQNKNPQTQAFLLVVS